MKCENCGYVVNPGDQVCIHCGAKLSVANAIMPEVGETVSTNAKNSNRRIFVWTLLGIVVLVVIVFVIIKFVVLKG
ncbi:MAG: hypothetical protein K2M17_05965 [Bacilli bacterium]|nr:hypothetical protein [Bacilli bacterium]